MKTRIQIMIAKLKLWLMIRWYGIDTIERGLERMATEKRQENDAMVYVLEHGVIVRVRVSRMTIEATEPK